MKFDKRLGMVLLGIWLVATGLLPLVGASLGNLSPILDLLAVAAGAVILLGDATSARGLGRRLFGGGKSTGGLGMLLLGIWLIAVGALPLLKINFPSQNMLLALLAIAAGVLILLNQG